jgi:putative hydrolase of the HAD superfamily
MPSQPKPKGILFDLFGTIVVPFSRMRHIRALAAAAEALALDAAHCDAAWDADYHNRVRGKSGGIASQLHAIAVAQGVSLRQEQLEQIVISYAVACDEFMLPVANAAPTLRALADLSIPIGLVSNIAPDLVLAFERSSLRPFFETCAFSCVLGTEKPEPAIYITAANALGIEPGEILFVGDGSDNELAGAARAGLRPVLVETDHSDTYDPERDGVSNWDGARLRDLSEVVELFS